MSFNLMLLRVVSNCFLNSTVVSLQPSPPSAINRLTFQTTPQPYLLSERTSSTLKHFCFFYSFLLWDILIALKSASTSFSRQISWVGFDMVCLSLNSAWWAVSCSTQTCASCCSLEIFMSKSLHDLTIAILVSGSPKFFLSLFWYFWDAAARLFLVLEQCYFRIVHDC